MTLEQFLGSVTVAALIGGIALMSVLGRTR